MMDRGTADRAVVRGAVRGARPRRCLGDRWSCSSRLGAVAVLYRFAALNYFVIILNLVPLLELDGYWILSDLIQVRDLRPGRSRSSGTTSGSKIRARERLTLQEIGLGLYGDPRGRCSRCSRSTAVFFGRRTSAGSSRGSGTGARTRPPGAHSPCSSRGRLIRGVDLADPLAWYRTDP